MNHKAFEKGAGKGGVKEGRMFVYTVRKLFHRVRVKCYRPQISYLEFDSSMHIGTSYSTG
jgi:hypothetical protein